MRDLTVAPGSEGVLLSLSLPGAFWVIAIPHHWGPPSESERLPSSVRDLPITQIQMRCKVEDFGWWKECCCLNSTTELRQDLFDIRVLFPSGYARAWSVSMSSNISRLYSNDKHLHTSQTPTFLTGPKPLQSHMASRKWMWWNMGTWKPNPRGSAPKKTTKTTTTQTCIEP